MDLCQYISHIFLLKLHENKEKLPLQVTEKCWYYMYYEKPCSVLSSSEFNGLFCSRSHSL